MAADGMVPGVTRTTAAAVLEVQDQWVIIFYEELFRLPALSQWWEIMENAHSHLYFRK